MKRPVRLQLFDRDSSGYASLGNLPALTTPANGKIRGSSSAGFAKKSYSIEFTTEAGTSRDLSPLGLPAGEDFALISCYGFDRPFMRNAWIYEAARQAGFISPQFRFVEVFFNQNNNNLDYSTATAADYRGVYILVQSIRVGKNIVDLNSLGSETDQPGVSGGYIFKFDRGDSDEFAWKTNRNQPPNDFLVIHRPKADKLVQPQTDYLENYIQTFENTLYTEAAAGFPTRHYTNHIDPDSWVLHNIFNMFPKNVDALRLSAYFHKDRGRRLEGGILWDFDRSADNTQPSDNRDAAYDTWLGTVGSTDYFTYSWWRELFKDTEFRQLYIDHYTRLRRGPLGNANIANLLATFKAEFKSTDADHPAKRDYARWYSSEGNFDTYVSDLQTWLTNRGEWIDSQFTAAPQSSLASSVVSSGETTFTLTIPSGTTVHYTMDGSDPRSVGGGVSPTAITYGGENITISSTVRLRARAWKSGTFTAPVTNWSGLEEQNYLVGETHATRENLRVSAIHFSPQPLSSEETTAFPEADSSHFEWIELKNSSASPVNLDGVTLVARSPVGRVILPARTLFPGERVVIAKNPSAFILRHGAGSAALVTGEWTTGHELDNTSADILLLERDQATSIADFEYHTSWIGEASTAHHAMEYVGPDSEDESYQTSSNWYASTAAGGSPGIGSTYPETIHLWQFTAATLPDLISPQQGNGLIRYTLAAHADAKLLAATGSDFPSGNNHLRLNMPIGGEIIFHIPSWGYEAIQASLLTARSGSGAGTQHWSYSVDGLNFLPLAEHQVTTVPQLLQLDLSDKPGTSNNPFLTLKVTFSQGGGGTSGNNRFDDFSVSGLPLENNELAGFHLWRQQKFTASEWIQAVISGPSADPDNDGQGNLLEYALGLQPKEPSVSDVKFAWQGGNPALAFTRPTGRDDVSYELWASGDLKNWARVENANIEITPLEEFRESVILGDPEADPAEPRRFFRLHVRLDL
ncbi:MAG: CotH kinase family protein [Luteolibacter sp.]